MKENVPFVEGDHDGIREYDHPVPGWLAAIFYGTAAFAVLYFVIFEIGGGTSIEKEFQAAMQAHDAKRFAQQLQEESQKPDPAQVKAWLADENRKKKGSEIYAKNCVSCHGTKGEGGIGTNLSDRTWIHGGSYEEILTTIRNGVLEKGMPSWRAVLGPDDAKSVAVFVYGLHGTYKGQGGKAPEGTEVKR